MGDNDEKAQGEERQRLPSGEVVALKRSEKIKNYATAISLAIPAISGLIIGLVALNKGEPKAEKAYETLQEEVNKQAEVLKDIHLKLAKHEGWEEGKQAGKLQLKLDQLQRRYDALLAKYESAKGGKKPAPPSAAKDDCPLGQVRIKGKCKKPPKAVSAVVAAMQRKEADTRRRLLAEKQRRIALERKKAELLRQLQQQRQRSSPIYNLRRLPAKLDHLRKK